MHAYARYYARLCAPISQPQTARPPRAMPASTKLDLDDLFSSDEETPAPAPRGRLSTATLQRAYDSRATPRPKLVSETQPSARATPALPMRAAAEAAQSRSRAGAVQNEPTTRRFDFLAPAAEGGLVWTAEGGLVEANAAGQAALNEAACFDAACGGSSLAEHMTSLLQVVPPNTGAGSVQSAAVDAALEARHSTFPARALRPNAFHTAPPRRLAGCGAVARSVPAAPGVAAAALGSDASRRLPRPAAAARARVCGTGRASRRRAQRSGALARSTRVRRQHAPQRRWRGGDGERASPPVPPSFDDSLSCWRQVREEKAKSEESVALHAASLRGSLESLVVAQGGSRAGGRRAGGGAGPQLPPPPPPPPQQQLQLQQLQQLPAQALTTPRGLGAGRAARHGAPLSSAATARYGAVAEDEGESPEQPRTRRVATGESPWRHAQPARNGAFDYDSD